MKNENPYTVIFRSDASINIGSGHVMRCLALAYKMHHRGWRCVLAVSQETLDIVPFLKDEIQFKIKTVRTDHNETEDVRGMISDENANVIIIDHYDRDEDYESSIKSSDIQVVVLDDLANRKHDCDALIDQTFNRQEADYAALVSSSCKMLMGTDYAILKQEYSSMRERAIEKRGKHKGGFKNIMISLGSTNLKNCTGKMLDYFFQCTSDHLDIDVVLTSSAHKLEDIKRQISRLNSETNHKVTLHINASNMAELMLNADLAIGAGGTTSWERCCLGLPTIMIEIADNQTKTCHELHAFKAAKNMGKTEDISEHNFRETLEDLIANPRAVQDMSQNCFSICDGRGIDRILPHIIPKLQSRTRDEISLRFIESSDEDITYAWQTETNARRFSRNTTFPSKEEHKEWVAHSIQKETRFPYIILCNEKPCGIIRLDQMERKTFEISILISEGFQKRGIAYHAHDLMRILHANSKIYAHVMPENTASILLFEKLGYERMSKGEFILTD